MLNSDLQRLRALVAEMNAIVNQPAPDPLLPTPVLPGVQPPVVAPTVNRRLGAAFAKANARILPNPIPVKSGDVVYMVRDVFTTVQGSWEKGDNPDDAVYEIEPWARADYLRPWGRPDTFDDAGGAHNFFAAVIGLDGQLMRDCQVRFWTPDYPGNESSQRTKPGSGWCNIVLDPGSNFVPERGEHGPFACAVGINGTASETFVGAGLPAHHHISWFVVFVAVKVG